MAEPITHATTAALAAQPSRWLARLGGATRVWALVGCISLLVVVVDRSLLQGLPAEGHLVPWWALALLFYVAEANVVHLHFRREAHTLSLNEIPIVIGLFFTPPEQLVLAIVV